MSTAGRDCIRYAEGYKYQLLAPYAQVFPELADPRRTPVVTGWLLLLPDGSLQITAGYAWDGASGPTYDSRSSMRASLVHDALYQLMREGHLDREGWRPVADAIFYRLCEEDGMLTPRAWLWFHMVRIFARSASEPAAEARALCAPCDCVP